MDVFKLQNLECHNELRDRHSVDPLLQDIRVQYMHKFQF